MSVLADWQIRNLCNIGFKDDYCTTPVQKIEPMGLSMVAPFAEQTRVVDGRKVVSYGVSSYGYDARLGNEFQVFAPDYSHTGAVDPKDFDSSLMREVHVADHEALVMPPHSFVLAKTKEYFAIPRGVVVTCIGKSTYARCGLIVNVTPLEPEWHGVVTMEISNTSPLPCKLYAGEGVCQFMFHVGDARCEISYGDKGGKYQGQTGITHAKV